MIKNIALIIIILLNYNNAYGKYGITYAEKICKNIKNYKKLSCYTIKNNKITWEQLYPNEESRNFVKRINRTNHRLRKNMVVLIPSGVDFLSYLIDYSPFPLTIETKYDKLIIVDPNVLAWGTYKEGTLINWGPISAGRSWCDDIKRRCKTPSGEYEILTKQNRQYRSPIYPIGCIKGVNRGPKACARMPYSMKFRYSGESLHGADNLPGLNDSHGCIRLLESDSEWLSKNFVDIGTKIIVKKY